MAKSQDAKKNVKKQPTRTPAEKKALKQEKKNKQDKQGLHPSYRFIALFHRAQVWYEDFYFLKNRNAYETDSS